MRAHAPSKRGRGACRGFTYLGILFAVAILGLALASAGQLYSVAARRDREAQLLWVGMQYRQAIGSYYLKGPPGLRQYPASLEDLLEDTRGPTMVRHLRRLYPDPMTGRADWDLERFADGSIVGVRSKSVERPIKQARFEVGQESFASADCYCSWVFMFVPLKSQSAGVPPAP